MKASWTFRYEEKNVTEKTIGEMEWSTWSWWGNTFWSSKYKRHIFEVQNIRNECGGKGRAEETEQWGMGLYDMLVIMQNEDKTKDFKQANEGVRCRSHRESSQLSVRRNWFWWKSAVWRKLGTLL